jgi:hypothetical protein
METNKIKWDKKMAERCLMRWNIEAEQAFASGTMRNDSEEQQWEEFKKKLDKILGK